MYFTCMLLLVFDDSGEWKVRDTLDSEDLTTEVYKSKFQQQLRLVRREWIEGRHTSREKMQTTDIKQSLPRVREKGMTGEKQPQQSTAVQERLNSNAELLIKRLEKEKQDDKRNLQQLEALVDELKAKNEVAEQKRMQELDMLTHQLQKK